MSSYYSTPYATPTFTEKAQKYNKNTFEKVKNTIQTQDRLPYPRLGDYHEIQEGQHRAIAKIFNINNQQVICLLDILAITDSDYREFKNQVKAGTRAKVEDYLNLNDAEKWLTGEQKSQNTINDREPLPEAMRQWLEPPGWGNNHDDLIIYESEEWIKRFIKREIQDRKAFFYQLIQEIIENKNQEDSIKDWPEVFLSEKNNIYILFARITTTNLPVREVLFLLAPFDKNPDSFEIQDIRKNIGIDLSKISLKNIKLEELTPFARRSYPYFLIADYDYWLSIEEEKESNLALSAEEEQILQAVSSPEKGSSSLPIFINGRAGSGKSTMLFHLFSDYCFRQLINQNQQEQNHYSPLFLTYNSRLLDVAKTGVLKLLSSHHEYLAKSSQELSKVKESDIKKLFQPFQDFLLNLLPRKKRDRFSQENYLSFYRFKVLYGDCQLPQSRKYKSEICWHVIRTFIKGYSLIDYMTPDDYETKVNRKDRSISVEEFRDISDSIWEKWYKSKTSVDGYWDDQDLIRAVLNNTDKNNLAKYTAIFCDEAQDFTRLELQLIMQLSIFSKYDLGNYPIRSLPFAFAGDPLQTLNPTGFRWSNLQAAFHDEIIKVIDPEKRLNLDMNLQELQFNYRSSPSIVKFINLIQLWRKIKFDLPEIKPQREWQKGDFPEPEKFILDKNITVEELKRYIQDTIIIIPCDEGGEEEYTKQDEILSQVFLSNSDNNSLKNILSPIAAKGLEFKRVILYKFGESCDSELWANDTVPEDNLIELEYYFNKLYVASSRAMERLFIIDSEKGDQNLWSNLSKLNTIDSQIVGEWQNHINQLSEGMTTKDLSEDDPLSIAEEFETKGQSLRNPDLLRKAKQYYTSAGHLDKSELCEASALEIEEKYLQAGQIYLKQNKVDQAWECFWNGMKWLELIQLSDENQGNQKIEYQLATFMLTNQKDINSIDKFSQVLEKAIGNDTLGNPYQPQWKKVIEEYTKRIDKSGETKVKKEQWEKYGQILRQLENKGYSVINDAGKCFYKAGNYTKAIQCWDNSSDKKYLENSLYYRAKAEISDFPESLEWYKKADDKENLIEVWYKHGGTESISKLDNSMVYAIASILEVKKNYEKAISLYIHLNSFEKVRFCYKKLKVDRTHLDVFKNVLAFYIDSQNWEDLIDTIEQDLSKIKVSPDEKSKLFCDLVQKLANSELTEDAMNSNLRQRYEKFMKLIEWQRYNLSMQLMGATFERLGGYGVTLDFYSSFLDNSNSEIQQFARERWLVTKRKQEKYHSSKGETNRAKKIRDEIEEKSSKWKISDLTSLPTYPLITPEIDVKPNKSTEIAEAVEMLQLGNPPEKVAKWTGLPLEEVLKLE